MPRLLPRSGLLVHTVFDARRYCTVDLVSMSALRCDETDNYLCYGCTSL